MAMRSSNSPRRVYPRAGSLVTCFGGVYFGPKSDASSAIVPSREVRIEVLAPTGGRKSIKVTQRTNSAPAVVEVWTEKKLAFAARA